MTIEVEEPTGLLVTEYNGEPSWLKIGWAYNDLYKVTHKLHADLDRYKAALNELDGAGTDIGFGKERIAMLREEINQLEAAK